MLQPLTFPCATNSPLTAAALNIAGGRLRAARDRDIPFLRRLYRSTRAEELARAPWTEAQKAVFCDSQFDMQHQDWTNRFPRAWFLIVTHRSTPTGRLYVDADGDSVRIVDIALMPDWRGRGLGTALIEAVIAIAGDRAVTLHVQAGSPAARLYRRLGFVEGERVGQRFFMTRSPRRP